jgi:hypothetical protein
VEFAPHQLAPPPEISQANFMGGVQTYLLNWGGLGPIDEEAKSTETAPGVGRWSRTDIETAGHEPRWQTYLYKTTWRQQVTSPVVFRAPIKGQQATNRWYSGAAQAGSRRG